MDRALYDESIGFFARGGGAGRREGDFLTSPEVGPLFGEVLARAVWSWWRQLGQPEEFTVVDAGAGRGTLARAMVGAGLPAGTRYVMVERSGALAALARRAADDLDRPGIELVVVDEMPSWPLTGVVIANELLDNLACRVVERTDDGWVEWYVATDGEPRRINRPAGSVHLPAGSADVAAGTALPLVEEAAAWVEAAVATLDRGVVVAFDYGVRRTSDLAGRPWLRTYAGHRRGADPFASPAGTCDITIDVPLDQLPPPDEVMTQAGFLTAHGIDELVEEGRRVWAERAHLGDLAAIRARSRVVEAEALLDPAGLGAFLVAEWRR